MKELNLHEEIIKSLMLITYDRSLTLNEQVTLSEDWAEDLLGSVKQAPKIDHEKIKNEKIKLFGKDNKRWGLYQYKTVDDIKKMLNILINKKRLKYDGIVDTNTINTIKDLQKSYGLPISGKIDNKTYETFEEKYKEKKGEWKRKRSELEHDFEQTQIKQNKISKYNCKTRLQKKSTDPSENIAKKVFLELQSQVGEHWYNVKSWGTNEKKILNALKLINNNNTYKKVLDYIDLCYPESEGMTIIEFIQSEEFSPGQAGLEQRVKNPATAMGVGAGTPVYASWYLNDLHLKSYQQILQKFNKEEKYYQENPYKEKTKSVLDKISKEWKTQVPPYAREVFHNVTMLASIAVAIFSGGATAPLLISLGIDLVDATAFWVEGDPYMAGLCAIFAIIPLGGVAKNQIKKGIQWYKELKSLTPAARKEAISESPFKNLFEYAGRKRTILSVYNRLFRIKFANIVKKIKDVGVLAKFLVWLLKKGFITIKFLTKLGLMVGGVFVSWYVIAKKLGIKEVENPYKKIAQERLNSATKNFVIDYLKEQKSLNPIYSLNSAESSRFRLPILLIQFCLKAGGYDVTNKEMTESTPEWEKKTPQGQVNFNYKPKYDYLYTPQGKTELENKRLNWKKSKKSILTKDFTKEKLPFKWGYFDQNMDTMIKKFQKNHNLKSNGVIDNSTLSSLISDLQSGKMNSIKNYSSHKLTEEEQRYLYFKDVEKEELKQYELLKIERKQLDEEYLKKKNEYDKSMVNRLDDVEHTIELPVDQWEKMMLELDNLYSDTIK